MLRFPAAYLSHSTFIHSAFLKSDKIGIYECTYDGVFFVGLIAQLDKFDRFPAMTRSNRRDISVFSRIFNIFPRAVVEGGS